jgi:hypothetical protein
MNTLGRALVIGLACLASAGAPRPAIEITGGWMRPAAAGMNGAGYMTLVNSGAVPDRLVAAASPAAARVTLHQSRQVGMMMTMAPVPFLAIPPGGRAVLSPGGYHLMFEHLVRPLRVGDHVPLTLTFARGRPLRVSLAVANAAVSGRPSASSSR